MGWPNAPTLRAVRPRSMEHGVPTSLADRAVFVVTNAWVYLTRPFFVVRCHRRLGYWPDFARPRRLSELVQWRKLFDRNPAFVTFADKLATKAWIAERVPDLAIPETIWVGERPEDVPDSLLTPGHVIKTNNASGQNHLPHRSPLARGEFDRQFRRWLGASAAKRHLGWLDQSQEWTYWKVPPKILVERQVGAGRALVDISVRVFDGEAFLANCALDFKTEASADAYFWPDGTRVAQQTEATLPANFAVPPAFHRAVRAAERLAQGFDYLRVDFLADGDTLFAGEITCFPASGFSTDEWFLQLMYRRWLETLHLSWALATPQPWPRRIYLAAFRRWLSAHRAELASKPLPLAPKARDVLENGAGSRN